MNISEYQERYHNLSFGNGKWNNFNWIRDKHIGELVELYNKTPLVMFLTNYRPVLVFPTIFAANIPIRVRTGTETQEENDYIVKAMRAGDIPNIRVWPERIAVFIDGDQELWNRLFIARYKGDEAFSAAA